MKRHARILVGSITLMAMTFSLAETLAASACCSMGETMASEVMGALEDAPRDCALDCQLPSRDDRTEDDPCPSDAGIASGCATAVSLPSSRATTLSPYSKRPIPIGREPVVPDLLVIRTLFRPPRA